MLSSCRDGGGLLASGLEAGYRVRHSDATNVAYVVSSSTCETLSAYNTANLYAYDLGSNSWSHLRPCFLRLASLSTPSMLLAACVAPVCLFVPLCSTRPCFLWDNRPLTHPLSYRAVAAATGPLPSSVVSPGYGVAGGKVYWFGGLGPGATAGNRSLFSLPLPFLG
eukprot:2434009-Rhodomonas_salina.1